MKRNFDFKAAYIADSQVKRIREKARGRKFLFWFLILVILLPSAAFAGFYGADYVYRNEADEVRRMIDEEQLSDDYIAYQNYEESYRLIKKRNEKIAEQAKAIQDATAFELSQYKAVRGCENQQITLESLELEQNVCKLSYKAKSAAEIPSLIERLEKLDFLSSVSYDGWKANYAADNSEEQEKKNVIKDYSFTVSCELK